MLDFETPGAERTSPPIGGVVGRWATGFLCVLAAICILFVMLITFVDVFLRYWFAKPISGSSEMVAFALALMVFAALPLVTLDDGHISVSLLQGHLNARAAWIERLVALLFSLVSTFIISYELFRHGIDQAGNAQTTPVLNLPLAPLTYAMSALTGLTVAAVAALLVTHLRAGPRRTEQRAAVMYER